MSSTCKTFPPRRIAQGQDRQFPRLHSDTASDDGHVALAIPHSLHTADPERLSLATVDSREPLAPSVPPPPMKTRCQGGPPSFSGAAASAEDVWRSVKPPAAWPAVHSSGAP